MRSASTLFSPLVHLFYPHICNGCGSDLVQNDNLLCLACLHELPRTNFARQAGNPVEKIFWGRLPLVAAMSAFYFGKGSVMQKLIHEFKYKANKELGEFLGTMMGELLLESDRFKNIDAVIPLPLFAAKEYKRGFNQATILSNGISKAMNIPVVKNNVTRKRFTETQTKKHRTDRWENVSGSFEIIQPDLLTGKHILLVDDVVTTGATLEACGTEILKMKETKLSIATLAFASK